jgi:integrase
VSRERVLSDAELAEIWRACEDDEFGKMVKLLTLTGCRRQEIGGLQWSEVNLDEGTITISGSRTKNHHQHTLPLSPTAEEIVRSVPVMIGKDTLFGNGARGFVGWEERKAAFGVAVKDWQLHDLRRTMATSMCEHGVEPHIVEQILNHTGGHKAGVAGVYNKARYRQQIVAALAWWDDHLRVLAGGGEVKVIPFAKGA